MNKKHNTGYVLITALLLLVVITILGVSTVGNVTRQERMISNMQEKQRSLEAASIALVEGEGYLVQQIDYPGGGRIKSGAAIDIKKTGIEAGVFTNPDYTVAEVAQIPLGGELTPASQMGKRSQSKAYFYSVSAKGTGGNANAVSTLQSIYGRIY